MSHTANKPKLFGPASLSGLLCLFCLFWLSACAGHTPAENAAEAENQPSLIAEAAKRPDGESILPGMKAETISRAGIKFPDEQYQRDTDCFSIETHTPYLGLEAIDEQIRNWEDGLRAEAIREFMANCASGARNNRLDLTYETSATFGNVVSVLLLPSMYTGGAHPITNVASLNFDTRSGKQLEYEDIFNNTEGLYEYLSDYAYRAMRPALGEFWGEGEYFAGGLEAVPENFKYFTLTPEGLVLIFPHYQVAPYSAGIQSCLVPLPELLRFQPRPGIWQ
ncbi:MAG: RsiV family protein [Deltaproteobacteria bacterium]|jgi:hypothetical protein|nr:RsiV family protein [Deltaproteobacteria bacterium]